MRGEQGKQHNLRSLLSLSSQCTHVVRDRASTCEGKPRRLLRECQNSLRGRLQLTSYLSLSLSLSSLSLSSQCTHVVCRWCAGGGGGFSACERGETKAPSKRVSEFPPSFFWGGASARKLSLLEFSPSFAVWGGRLLIARG